MEPASSRPESAISQVADLLRARVIAGDLLPGDKLSQERVQESLGVSRSTLREALQVLTRERLMVHELGRGVFVRQLTRSDIVDLYRVRRVVECAAVQGIEVIKPARLRALTAAIDEGQSAVDADDWRRVGAASIRFHEALVGLAESERLNSVITGILAEFRLAYAFMSDTDKFHAAFLKRHRGIVNAIATGDLAGAAAQLDDYLADAEEAVLAAYEPQ